MPLRDLVQPLRKGLELAVALGGARGVRVEARGQALFSAIDGDRSAIQGLPMQRLVRLLRAAGANPLLGA